MFPLSVYCRHGALVRYPQSRKARCHTAFGPDRKLVGVERQGRRRQRDGRRHDARLAPGPATLTTPIVPVHRDYIPVDSPPGMSNRMCGAAYAAAPTVKVIEIAPSLHFIMLDQPAKFEAALDGFLAQGPTVLAPRHHAVHAHFEFRRSAAD